MLDPTSKRSVSDDTKLNHKLAVSDDENELIVQQISVTDTKEIKKTCADCGTSKTPLWRGGPAGPKSLCNACGIRSRKKRRAVVVDGSELKKPRKRSGSNSSGSSSSSSSNGGGKLGESLKQRLYALGREVLTQRSTVEKQRRKLGEDEQAAVLLMALSYGSVYG